MKDTLIRVATALVLVPIVLSVLYLSGYAWAILVATVAARCVYEFYGLAQARNIQPYKGLGVAATVALILAAEALPASLVWGVLAAAGVASVAAMLLDVDEIEKTILNFVATLAGIIYIAVPLMHGVWFQHMNTQSGHNLGFFAMFFIMAATFLADTGGYFGGRSFGKHKLAPKVSPKKTWEGLIGGILFGAAGGIATVMGAEAFFEFPAPISPIWAGIIGGLNAVVGVAGDLSESVLKRSAGVKDSSNLLPGHGGMLDRIDAILFTVPVNYYLFYALVVGHI